MRCAILLGLWLVGCTPVASEAEQPAASAEAGSKRARGSWPSVCAQLEDEYLDERERLSYCESDSECAIWRPGWSDHGPFYFFRDADIEPMLALERELSSNCPDPFAKLARDPAIPHCEQGTCAAGREPAVSSKWDSCWDYRESWLEPGGTTMAAASSVLTGVTPLVAIAPASSGMLTLTVDWPLSCADCELWISEHNSGMANRITAKASSAASDNHGEALRRELLEFPVTPGPYYFVGMASADVLFTIRADLRDETGERGRVTRHGLVWQRMCEG